MNDAQVDELLARFNVPIQTWGTGAAKTRAHLDEEIRSGETKLIVQDDMLIRSAKGVLVDVYYEAQGVTLYLIEKSQVFTDGRTKKRTTTGSIGEKLKPGELPIAAAHRALSEELGLAMELRLVECEYFVKGPVPSDSYPGIYSRYEVWRFKTNLPPEAFRPQGYVERQHDKSSYFEWIAT